MQTWQQGTQDFRDQHPPLLLGSMQSLQACELGLALLQAWSFEASVKQQMLMDGNAIKRVDPYV